jgi:hypothetical protein
MAKVIVFVVTAFSTLLGVVPAHADGSTGGSSGSALAKSDFSITVQAKNSSGSWSALSTTGAKNYFDGARCTCNTTVRFVVEAATSTAATKISTLLAASGADGEGRLYLGESSACTTDPTDSSYGCVLLDQIDELGSLAKKGYWTSTEVSLGTLFGASDGSCTAVKTQYLWFWVDTSSDGSADLTGDSAPSLSLRLDGKAPGAPTALSAKPGKEALLLTWTASTSTSSSSSDLAGYLVFCKNADGSAVFSPSPYNSQYVTPATLSSSGACPSDDTLGIAVLDTGFSSFGAGYLCSGLIAADQTSYRLKNLHNDLAYTLFMVAVDNDGNVSTASDAVTGTPVMTVDFYNEYVNEGGTPVGGYCSFAQHGAHIGVAALLVAAFAVFAVFVVLGRRRFRRGRFLLVVVVTLPPSAVSAQAIYYDSDMPVIDEGSVQQPAGQSARSATMEFRMGPYHPDVDSGLSNGASPHDTVFGAKTRFLYSLEVDYDILQRFGTLAVGGGIGYFRESAAAFVGTNAGISTGARSSDDTALRLIPFSLLAVYRFDVFAERWKVPLVPYAKAGLNYTLWKVTDGNGGVATLTVGGRGNGGTLGWQASAGLAFQLDALDPASMRELDSDCGLNHMYLFAEWSHIDAGGLGLSNRLHVGDSTWSAGLLLEF